MKYIFLIIVASVAGFDLYAQTGSEETLLKVITVKGTKEEKEEMKTPESVSVLQESELTAIGPSNNLEVLSGVSNVQINKNGESFSLRGISNTGVTGYQKDNLASLVIDGMFQTELALEAGSFDLWDQEQIEILKGAQSTTQGVNSLAGTILLDHKPAKFQKEGQAKLGAGNFAYKEVGVVTNNVLVKDRLTSRVSYNKELSDGYTTNLATGNDKWGKKDLDRVRGALQYKMSENDKLEFDLKFNRQRRGGLYSQSEDPFKYEVDEDQDFLSDAKNYQIIATYNKESSEKFWNTLDLGYSKGEWDLLSDADGTSTNVAGTRLEIHEDEYFFFENRLHYAWEKWENMFGIHGHNFKREDDYDFDLLFPLGGGVSTPVAVTQYLERTREVYALFDSVTYKMTPHHSLLGGLRGEYSESVYETRITGERLQDLGAAFNAGIDNYIDQIEGNYDGFNSDFILLPRIGYAFSKEKHYAGAVLKRGYRTAGVSINRLRAQAVEYGAEFTNNYEVFYKFKGDRFQSGVNLFYIDWEDQQVQVQLSNDFYDTQVQNAASSEVYGFEWDADVDLSSKYILHGSLGYSETRFKDFKSGSEDYTDNEFPFASPWTARVALEYMPTSKWSLLTVARYLGEAYQAADNERKIDEQYYLDLNASYNQDSWLLQAYVNNVLDGEFLIFNGTPTSTTSPYQSNYHQTSSPRTFGLRVNYYW